MRYAQWELEQKEYARARSIFERALDVDARSVVLWLRYIEAEMKTRNINHARNLLDRAVTILPRVDKLWYKYVYMEETLGNIPGTRQVFERWMSWEPEEAAWSAYIKLEKRYAEFERARAIFHRFTQVHPEPRNWIKWARFEEEFGTEDNVREVFTTAIETLGDEFMDEKLFIAYARCVSTCNPQRQQRLTNTAGTKQNSKNTSAPGSSTNTHLTGSHALNPTSSTKTTLHSKNSSVSAKGLKMSSSLNAEYNTKSRSQRPPRTTTYGSTMPASKKPSATPTESAMFMNAPSPTSLQPEKSATGAATSTSGSSTHYGKR
jgi:hypothetical protein